MPATVGEHPDPPPMVLGDSEHTAERYVAMSLTSAALELGCDLDALQRAARAFRA